MFSEFYEAQPLGLKMYRLHDVCAEFCSVIVLIESLAWIKIPSFTSIS